MSLRDIFRSIFGGGEPPALRNRPGGLARIRGITVGFGGEQLNGRYVITEQLLPPNLWRLDPPQDFTVTASAVELNSGRIVLFGGVVRLEYLEDHYLEPVPDVADDARDESLSWLPAPPKHWDLPAPSQQPTQEARHG